MESLTESMTLLERGFITLVVLIDFVAILALLTRLPGYTPEETISLYPPYY